MDRRCGEVLWVISMVMWSFHSCRAEEIKTPISLALRSTDQDAPIRPQSAVEASGHRVLDHYADKQAAQYGILDVTHAPYSADPTGKNDSTPALQQAMKDARDARLITYLPGGTYRVSDTITCIEGGVRSDQSSLSRENPNTSAAQDNGLPAFPCVLVGSRTGRRTRIVLVPHAAGFGDAREPKPVIHFWARSEGKAGGPPVDPGEPDPSIAVDQMIVDVDLVLGQGNPGAVGIDHQGAQGSVIEDVAVDATGAFAGIHKAPGSGGGIHDLTVIGGRYGLYLKGDPRVFWRGAQPVPVVSNVTLKGQTVLAILYDGRGPLTVVGGRIEGAGVQAQGPPDAPWNGAMNFVDSIFRTRQGVCAIASNHSVYLHEVYFAHSKTLVCVEGRPALQGMAQPWTHLEEYVAAATLRYPSWLGGGSRQDAVYVEGRAISVPEEVRMDAAAPPVDLQNRHALPPLPSWGDPGVANVKAGPYGARGDGRTDDAAALQRAIDEHEAVFLPKGEYKLSRPLVLKSRTQLFGLTNTLSVLSPMMESPEYGYPDRPAPLIDTVNDPQARTYLAFAELHVPVGNPAAYALRWRAGRHSVVRDINPSATLREPDALPRFHPMIRIEASGGGRWYDLFRDQDLWNQGPDFRHLLVEGTREPLAFYMLDPEHASSEAQVEFHDAQNVNVYSLKSEGIFTTLWMRNCRGVRIYGYGGVGAPRPNRPLFRIENSDDFLLANINPESSDMRPGAWNSMGVPSDPRKWILISDAPGRSTAPIELHGIDQVALYRRGNSQY
jgi:hypothetical protein